MLIGNHLTSSKGYLAMGKMAVSLDANTFAFFTRNPRGGKAKEINPKDVEEFLEIAQNNNIPIVENRLVARTLYQLVEINDIIPSDMFQAVAEILAYVYNNRKR